MLPKIDKTWTLFLDRDGVINKEKKDDYIKSLDEFEFYDGVLDAFKIFNEQFGRIIVITNQRGVGKGLMSENSLIEIHEHIQKLVNQNNGRIDDFFYCTDIDNSSINRKPNPGMAFQAKDKFTEIDFSKTLMVGNRLSDMKFGRNANIKTVYLDTTNPEVEPNHADIDFRYRNLFEFALAIHQ